MEIRRRIGERQWRGAFGAAAIAAVVGACDWISPAVPLRFQPDTKVFRGVVASDEPRASLIGESILNGGGTAGDAAAAVALALAVTYPAAAGLGGGGACLAYDPTSNEAQSVDFLPRRANGGGPIAVPGFTRGIGAVHGRYGRMPIGQVIAPAENLARFGNQASRAFVRRLEAAQDPELSRNWRTANLAPLAIGRNYTQPDLAGTLEVVRVKGFASLHVGPGGRAVAEALNAAGGRIEADELRDFSAEWKKADSLITGDVTIHVGGGGLLGAPTVLANWRALIASGAYDNASTANKPVVLRGTVPGAGGEKGGTTSFIVADRSGLVIGCVLTLGQEFGSRRLVGDLGFVAATPPEEGGTAAFIVVSQVLKRTFAVGAASGPGAPAALLSTFAPMWIEGKHVDYTIAERPVAGDARVNIVFCPNSIPSSAEICYPATDPRGFGLALGGVK
jgi:gamma-glutamyltranspeptidase/glutathione hydrolase